MMPLNLNPHPYPPRPSVRLYATCDHIVREPGTEGVLTVRWRRDCFVFWAGVVGFSVDALYALHSVGGDGPGFSLSGAYV